MVEMKKSWNICRQFIGMGMARTVSGSACCLAKTSLILLVAALSVACGSLNARSVSSKSSGSRVYKFRSTDVTALLSTLAVDVRITDGGAPEAVVEMPSDEVARLRSGNLSRRECRSQSAVAYRCRSSDQGYHMFFLVQRDKHDGMVEHKMRKQPLRQQLRYQQHWADESVGDRHKARR